MSLNKGGRLKAQPGGTTAGPAFQPKRSTKRQFGPQKVKAEADGTPLSKVHRKSPSDVPVPD
jgi:hypothetical protein